MTIAELKKLANEYAKQEFPDSKYEDIPYVHIQASQSGAARDFIAGFLAGRDAAADIAGKSWAMYDEDSIESEVAYDIQDSINKLGKEND